MGRPKLNFAVAAELIRLSKKHGSFTIGPDRWGFLMGQRLMWFDTSSHVCKIPSERFTNDFRLHTICGLEVTTPKLDVMEDGEFADPSCLQCLVKIFEQQCPPGRYALRTTLAAVMAIVIVAMGIALFADAANPPPPRVTMHQLTFVPEEIPEATLFDEF